MPVIAWRTPPRSLVPGSTRASDTSRTGGDATLEGGKIVVQPVEIPLVGLAHLDRSHHGFEDNVLPEEGAFDAAPANSPRRPWPRPRRAPSQDTRAMMPSNPRSKLAMASSGSISTAATELQSV